MNITDLIQQYFEGDSATQLGQAVGVDPALAQKALSLGIPMQLKALVGYATQPAGQGQLLEAIGSLPQFGSVKDVLATNEGAGNLQRAGELLAPALLGGQHETIVNDVTRQVGGSVGGIQKLLNMALPLLLSLLGRQGLNAGNIGSVLGGLDLSRIGAASLGSANLGSATTGTVSTAVTGAAVAGATVTGAAAGAAALGTPTVTALIDFLKAQFSGANAEKIGQAAGFGGSTSVRAVQGALPVILNAITNKAKTEAGAADLLKMAGPFAHLSDSSGQLNLNLLGDSAEMARLEGQGRGLLGGLFGNTDELTGRLGTALGGSGSNAGRLLAVMTPLVLSVLGKRAGSMGGSGLSGLLGGFGSHLNALVPAGLALGPLLGATTVAAAIPAATHNATVNPQPDEVVVAKAEPTVVEAPKVVTPPPPVTTTERVVEGKKGGMPWWMWLIPLLLLGLLFAMCNKKPAPVAAAPGCALVVSNPTSDSNIPAEAFEMSGKAPAGTKVSIKDQGQEVASADVDANCDWKAQMPAPTVGEHTYSVEDGDGKAEYKVNVTDASATDTGSTAPAAGAGTFAITDPAADAQLPAGGFELKGTGKAGDTVTIFEDATSLGNVTVGDDGNWSFMVPSPAAGDHKYSVKSADGTELGTVATTIAAAEAGAKAENCDKDFTLSMGDGQSITEPFRFGGVGKGQGYTVTVFRDNKRIGRKDVYLDSTCGWSYQSTPGKGKITYEVRELGKTEGDVAGKVGLDITN